MVIRVVAGCFILIAGIAFHKTAVAEKRKLIIGADQWCPHTCKSGSNFEGFSVDLLREALRRSGFDSEYFNASFSRVTSQVLSNRWHIHGATDKIFTPDLLLGKEVVARATWVFVTRKGSNWIYQGPASLEGKSFGSVAGYAYSDALTKYYQLPKNKRFMLQVAGDSAQLQTLRMLVSGRVDFIVDDQSVIQYWAQKLGFRDKIEFVGIDSITAYYPGFKKDLADSEELAQKIDIALRAVKQDRTYMDGLLKKYEIKDWR